MSTIGEQLKQAREARKLTIKQVVQATRVRSYYIEAMESDDFSAMPSAAQARGFLRLYADYLALDADALIDHQRTIAEENSPAEVVKEQTPPPPAPTPEAESPSRLPLPAEPPVTDTAPEAQPEPETPQPPAQPEIQRRPRELASSQKIFNEIGASLRERRELLSLTLDEIERHTHVRKHYLNLIETGDYEELPSPVQARGMLNAYASFLDMDTETILLRFAEALQLRRIERQPPEPPKPTLSRLRFTVPLWLRRFISPDLIFGGGMVLTLLALSIWGASRLFVGNLPDEVEATATETGPSISEVLLASPVGGVTPTEEILPTSVAELGTAVPTIDPALITPTDTALPTEIVFVSASAVQVTVIVLERTFLRVIVDDEIVQEGRVAPGAALTFDGETRIEVLTGSGAAIQVIYNQQDLGILGNFGEVVDRIYTIEGVQTPTPTPSATPTSTPRRPPTVTPSVTPLPTKTTAP